MGDKVGDHPEVKKLILDMGRAKLAAESGDDKGCSHPVLGDEGQQELPPKLQQKYPDGMRLGTCNSCGTTKGYYPYRWRQL